jgi:hypothetical protein
MYLVIGGAVLFAVVIGLVIYADIQRSIPVAGQETFTLQGNQHISADAPNSFTYNSIPPSSGPHYENIVDWGIWAQPQPYEFLLHNLEDGGVVIYYQCPEGCPDTVKALEEVVQPYLNANRRLILVPNDPTWRDSAGVLRHNDMGATIAATAWGKVLKLDTVDTAKLQTFVDKYEGINNHRPG